MNQTTATLPDAQAAYDHLYDAVHGEVFFRKCAAAGFIPNTPEEAMAMLTDAGNLRVVNQHQKQASAAPSPILAMHNAVQQAMGGVAPQLVAQQQDFIFKQAADDLLKDPDIFNSILVLKAAQAENIRSQLAAR